jgi:hypothetical protein
MSERKSARRDVPKHARTAAAKAGRPFTLTAGWAALVLGLLTVLFFHELVLEGKTFVSPDAMNPVGFVRMGEQSLYQDHVYPLWNPFVFLGMPSFGSGTYNPLIYPPDWPLALVNKVVPLPDMTWMLLYYFLGGLFLFLLARELGARSEGALLAAAVFTFVPNLVAVGSHGHGSQLVNSAYLPFMLWLAARWMRRGGLGSLAWLALAGGFQMLRGHVQICFYTWAAVVLYVAIEWLASVRDPGELARRSARAAGVALAAALAFGVAGFYNLPLQDYARWSIRGGGEGGGVGLAYATQWSFSPVELLTFLVPGAVGFGGRTYWGSMPFTDDPHYMGLALLALAAVGLARARRAATVAFLAALAAAAVLVAFGQHGFLYPLLYDHLPQFNKFRVPVMILLLTQLAVACLAGMGLDAVLEARAGGGAGARRTRWALLAAGAAAALVLVAGLMPDLWRGGAAALARSLRPNLGGPDLEAALAGAAGDAVRVGLLAAVALAAAWLALRGRLPAGGLLGVVALVTVVDLWVVNQRIVAPVLGPPAAAQVESERDEVIDFLVAQADSAAARGDQFRVLALGDDFRSNRYAGFALAVFGGYHAAKPKLAQEYLDALAPLLPVQRFLDGQGWQGAGFLNAANGAFVVAPGLVPPGTPLVPVFQGQRQMVYRNPEALPRASLATRFEVLPPDRQLARLLSPGYDPRAAVLLEAAPAAALGPAGGQVRITRYGLNSVAMEAETPGPAVLRFADLYFPGWTARVDGRETPILRADFAFRAVLLPAGRHRVEWSYQSRALRLGLWVSGAALLVIAGLFAAGARRRRTG